MHQASKRSPPDDIDDERGEPALQETATLEPTCPACGHAVPAGSRFCNLCGTALPQGQLPEAALSHQEAVLQNLRALMPQPLVDKVNAVATEIVGERREVTVLFLDIVNFTVTAHVLDSEDIYLWTDRAMRLLAEVIYEYEGTIDKYTGDGLMALFGVPVAHENDPERAIRAALDMVDALEPLQAQFKKEYGLDFEVRIGINTGLVIAGKIGSDLHVEYTVIGDTVNLADRLQSVAQSNTIAVSFTTYQRTHPLFNYETLPATLVKGKPHPVRVFRPLGLRLTPGQIRGLPGLQAPMVGRQQALAQVQSALAEMRQYRRGQVLLVTGEAGVGKSRLVNEFRKSVAHSEVSFYQGVCLTYARSNPLRLLASLLRDMMHLSEADPAEVQHAALRAHLDQLELETDDLMPYLLNVLGLEQEYPEIVAHLSRFDSSVLEKLIHAALRQVLLAEARLAPTVLVFDDLHWVDPASRAFLEHLIQTMDSVPLMLIMVSRDLERKTGVRPLIAAAESHHEHLIDIKLSPLSAEEGQQLVDQLLTMATDEANALKRRIAERAEGNPFYAEEIIRMLIDQGGLERENDHWRVGPQADELLQEVPGTLKGLVVARLDRLPDDLRQTVQKAAVLGSAFPLDLLQGLSSLSREAIASEIVELESRHFLIALPFGLGQGYAFRHTLIQEVLYSTLLKRDRQRIHAQVAEAIEEGTFWLPYDRVEALAYHYSESKDPVKAVPYLIDAAERAARRCANETAAHHYRQALTLTQDQPTSDSRQTLRIQLGLGQALKFIGEFSEASDVLEASLQHLVPMSMAVESADLMPMLIQGLKELADIRVREGALETAIAHLQAGLDALGELGAQEHPRYWRSLVDRLAWVRFRQGDLEKAFALASSATLGLDVKTGEDPMTLASLYNTLGGVFWQWGNLSEASDYVESSLELHQSAGYAWGMAIAYTNLGILHYAQGRWPEAIEYFERAYTLRRDNGYLPEQALNLSNMGQLRIAMGEHAQARSDLEAGLALSQQLGEEFGIVLAEIGLAQLAVIQSRFQDAVDYVEAVMDLAESAGDHQVAHAGWLLAQAQAGIGDLRAGTKTAQQALETARKAGITEMEADCRRVLGVLHAQAGDYLEAESLLRESVSLYLQLDAPYGRGLALFELGRLYRTLANVGHTARTEWRGKAVAVLSEATEQFERLGAAYDLRLAQAALSELRAEVSAEALLRESHEESPAPPGAAQAEDMPQGERRPVAIVWLGLRPPPDADEEVIFEAITVHLPAAMAIAEEYHGRVVRRQDGLTIVFGAPTSYEDDAERAVQTACRLVEHLQAVGDQTGLPLDFGLVVSQGDVIAGHIGPRFHTEFTVRGEPVRLAERIADSVPPGSVWVTGEVRAETERVFIYEPVEASDAPAVADLVLSTVVGRQEQPEPPRGLPGLRARLIGRETQLRKMIELSNGLNQSVGGLIWIEGEPGIGKSRLMAEFATSIAESGVLQWSGTSSPQKSDHAFSLFSDVFARALNVRPVDTPDQIRAKINQAIESWPRDAKMARAYLEMLLGVRPSGLEAERLAGLEPEQLRQQTFVALRRLFKSLVAQQPLVLLLDDLHWVDPMSAELLLFLLTMVASAPILFVCAQRRQGADLPNDRLVKVQGLIPTQTIQLTLQRLSASESEALLDELLPRTELPARIRQLVLEQSEGNPYFIEEFVRMLIEQGYLQHVDGGWRVVAGQDVSDLPVPSSLDVLVRSRIDALPPDLKRLLQEAAVIGAPFETDLLGRVSDTPNVMAGVRRLESRLLVRWAAEASQWHFSHPLIETVAYTTMLKARRRSLHLKVAQALEVQWAGVEADHVEQLAYHFTQTDQNAKALTYLVMAGERAAAQYANEEAISYLERAAERLDAEPEATDDLRWRIAAGLGDAYRAVGRHVDSIAILKAGLALTVAAGLSDDLRAGLYRRLGDTARKQGEMDTAREHYGMAMDILGQPTAPEAQTEISRSLTGVAWTYFLQGRAAEAREACEVSLEMARNAGAVADLATAENLMGGIYYRQSEWIPALHHTTRAMVLREQMGYTWGVASTLGNLGILAVSAGHWNKAWSFFERCLALQQDIGDIEGLTIAHNNLGSLARDQGKLDLAEHHFRESLRVATPFEMVFHIANSGLGLAHVLLLKGQITPAREAIAASLARAKEIGTEALLAEIHKIQAEILLARAKLDDARTTVEHAATMAARMGNRSLEAAGWRVASEIEIRRGDPRAAHEALSKAQRALVDRTDELESARVAAQAGRLYIYEGQYAKGEAQLRNAREIFMRLGASLELEHVEEALRQPSMADPRMFR
jgi:predicted ATPase/class 3 adenylate cyclase